MPDFQNGKERHAPVLRRVRSEQSYPRLDSLSHLVPSASGAVQCPLWRMRRLALAQASRRFLL